MQLPGAASGCGQARSTIGRGRLQPLLDRWSLATSWTELARRGRGTQVGTINGRRAVSGESHGFGVGRGSREGTEIRGPGGRGRAGPALPPRHGGGRAAPLPRAPPPPPALPGALL